MKLQIMAKPFDRMTLAVKASVDTEQDRVKFAAYRVRLFGVRRIGKSEQKCPVAEVGAVGTSRPCSPD
jgi:hypothetical protein